MWFNGSLKTLFDISDHNVFIDFQEKIKEFDWTHDKLLNLDSDPAFKDSFVIISYSSSIMEYIRNDFINYSADTIELREKSNSLCNLIGSLFPKFYLLKAHIVTLKPHGIQAAHIDEHFYHAYCNRLVLPILNNGDLSKFYINSVPYSLDNGFIYEFNNKMLHYSSNTSNVYRTSMFFDIVSPNVLPIFLKRVKHQSDQSKTRE